MDPLVILFGLGIGALVGLTGMGGGSLMTPVLIAVFGYSPVTAVGTDLAYGAVTKTLGGWRHLRHRTVHFPLAVWMGLGSVPAAIGGVYVLEVLKDAYGSSFDDALMIAVAGTVMFTGLTVLARALFMQHLVERERAHFTLRRRDKIGALVLGVVVGFVLGVTSAGSGTLLAVGLILLFRLVPTRVVGTDVFHAAVLLWAAALAHVVAGNVNYGLAGTILIGSLPGVWIGSHWAVRVPTAALRLGIAIVMIGSGLGLLSKAGAGIPAAVLAGVPVVLAIVIVWQQLAERARRVAEAKRGLPPAVAQSER